jgi:hypothetical protein
VRCDDLLFFCAASQQQFQQQQQQLAAQCTVSLLCVTDACENRCCCALRHAVAMGLVAWGGGFFFGARLGERCVRISGCSGSAETSHMHLHCSSSRVSPAQDYPQARSALCIFRMFWLVPCRCVALLHVSIFWLVSGDRVRCMNCVGRVLCSAELCCVRLSFGHVIRQIVLLGRQCWRGFGGLGFFGRS